MSSKNVIVASLTKCIEFPKHKHLNDHALAAKEKHNPGSQEGEVGWHLSKWLRADCLDLGGNWQPKDLSGQEVSTDHLCGRVCMQREGETRRMMRLARLSLTGLKHTEGWRARHQGWKSKVVWGHNDETQPSQKGSLSESERHRWAGRVGERVTKRRRGSCLFPPPFLPACMAVLAVPCSGEERLPKPSLRMHVWTQSLPLPC